MQPNGITEATRDDCEKVAALAAKTFSDAFGHLYRPENLAYHLLTKCSPSYYEQSIDAGDTILLLHEDGQLVGYAKVGHVEVPVKPLPRGAQEIHRVYVDKEFQGRGFGKALMLHVLSLPRIGTAPAVFLSVYEQNVKAQSLYTQSGFATVGHYLYQVGDQYDNEIIMVKTR
jgi:ribosomal protein S18 acetylase RimI-like enzyme